MGKFECPIYAIDLRGTTSETWQAELPPIGAIRTPALFPLRTGINVRTLRHDDAFRLGHRQRSSAHEACDDGRGCPSLGLKLRSCTPGPAAALISYSAGVQFSVTVPSGSTSAPQLVTPRRWRTPSKTRWAMLAPILSTSEKSTALRNCRTSMRW